MNRKSRRGARTGFDATTPLIEELIDDAKQTMLNNLEHDLAMAFGQCESPIEKLFAAALMHPSTAAEFDTRINWLYPPSGSIEHCNAPPIPGVWIWPQVTIGPYRVDFLLGETPSDFPKLIVECDGHDFHERTKEQAQRDKARDRFLLGRGYRIARFTGSEIFADPHAAAHQAIALLMGVSD